MRAKSSQRALSADTIVRVSPRQISCALRDEAVVLSMADGVYYGLNDVAARVWQLLEQPRSIGELCDAIVDEYEVGYDACLTDLIALCDLLEAWSLIEVEPAVSRASA